MGPFLTGYLKNSMKCADQIYKISPATRGRKKHTHISRQPIGSNQRSMSRLSNVFSQYFSQFLLIPKKRRKNRIKETCNFGQRREKKKKETNRSFRLFKLFKLLVIKVINFSVCLFSAFMTDIPLGLIVHTEDIHIHISPVAGLGSPVVMLLVWYILIYTLTFPGG